MRIWPLITIRLAPIRTIACTLLLGSVPISPLANEGSSESASLSQRIQSTPRQARNEQALATARKAVELSAAEKNSEAHLQALLKLAGAYQEAGQHANAVATLRSAMPVAEAIDDLAAQLIVRAGLGRSYAEAGLSREAKQWLTDAAESAAREQQPHIEATVLNNLGNLYQRESGYDKALAAYRRSMAVSARAGLVQLRAQSAANAARAALEMDDTASAKRFIDTAMSVSRNLEPSHETAYLLINTAVLLQDMHGRQADPGSAWSSQAYQLLHKARQIADLNQDARAKSFATGHIARLYLQKGRPAEALTLTREAEFIARQQQMPGALFRWQWQAGRILDEQGEFAEAITAYRQAVETLQPIRYDIAGRYGSSGSAFREVIGPLYFELADLLLRRPETPDTVGADSDQARLREARAIIERFKAAELEDYFQDDCVAELQSRTAGLDKLDAHTAVIYPISLPDRTELLVSLPQGIRQFTVPFGTQRVTHEIRALRRTLEKRTTHQYLPHARQLYDWFIGPSAEALRAAQISTLVIVPDGALRSIPWGALHDGKDFLIERFAIAYTPGLQVTDPGPLERQDLRILLSGLSTAVQDFPALPYVKDELERIHEIYGGTILLDRNYQTETLREALDKTPYSIVHIASHGRFSTDPDQTFLLTYRDRITMDELEQFVGIGRFRDKPVELLTLSACQTAAGDDRAALGLAGVAVKSGARSALATLWYVNDQATSLLIADFYGHLKNSTVSKARALQQAQITTLNDRRYRHPGYWSPYLLIGNWL